MGIFSDLTGMDSMIYGSNADEDAELEAELMALQQDSPKKTAVISSGNMCKELFFIIGGTFYYELYYTNAYNMIVII